MNFRKWAQAALLGLVVFAAFGCTPGKYTGGGFITSTAGAPKKATFGFNFETLDRDGDGVVDMIAQEIEENFFAIWWLGKGQFQFNDHGAGVRFHCDIDETYFVEDPLNDSADGVAGLIDEEHYFNTGEVVFLGEGAAQGQRAAVVGEGEFHGVETKRLNERPRAAYARASAR